MRITKFPKLFKNELKIQFYEVNLAKSKIKCKLKLYFMIIGYVVGLQIKAGSMFSFSSLSNGGISETLNSCVNQHANTILCPASYFDISFAQS